MNVAASTFVFLAMTLVRGYLEQLDGKIAVVTGGAKGIGYAIVNNYLKNGIKTIIIVDKNRPRGLKAEKELNCRYGGNRTLFIHGDITKDLDRVSNRIFRTFGHIDILVNNAGILDEHDPKKTIETNALGTVLWTHRFYDCMRKDKGGKGGTIVNIASVSAYMSDPFIPYYKASKFTILGLTLGLGHELNYFFSGVRIFAICPGLTDTDLANQPLITVTEEIELYDKVMKDAVKQPADAVGKAAVLLFSTASTGMAYTVVDGRPPVVSPDRVTETLESLLGGKTSFAITDE